MESVKIGSKDVFEEYGCYLASKSIGSPEPQYKLISIPTRNGDIDISTAVTDELKYDNREIDITLLYLGNDIDNLRTKLMEDIHGQKKQIIFDTDPNYYYEGRVNVACKRIGKDAYMFELECDCKPFKYDVYEHEYGTFSFTEQTRKAITRHYNDIIPTYICSDITSAITMYVDGQYYSLKEGSNNPIGIYYAKGSTTLTFNGAGTVEIKYREGRL